ncbi:hypothetical protein HYH03_017724 [Edaphochlamys debaryana]|uniref:Uncharacterized protein n=1 Tax=Edaphochlamys debaryana TaxID=47281 RepID=A0A836BP13_9CHLO|nr:hypothetical protein HYH03_017724 [Edaphochlamys debaryana]|eukprot:KAG2483417.1 hypothetical protein HYH03_017724 [Edaphochlamys debaryana]
MDDAASNAAGAPVAAPPLHPAQEADAAHPQPAGPGQPQPGAPAPQGWPQQPQPMQHDPWEHEQGPWDEQPQPWPQAQPGAWGQQVEPEPWHPQQPQQVLWVQIEGHWHPASAEILFAHPELLDTLPPELWGHLPPEVLAHLPQLAPAWPHAWAGQGAPAAPGQGAPAPAPAPARPAESECSSVRRPNKRRPASPSNSSASSVPVSRRAPAMERCKRHMRNLEAYVRQISGGVDKRGRSVMDASTPLPPLRQPPPNDEEIVAAPAAALPRWPPRKPGEAAEGPRTYPGPDSAAFAAVMSELVTPEQQQKQRRLVEELSRM